MTHYEILGIRKTATTDEIKTAYKQLVKKYHPDVYPGDKTFAEKKTQEINAAYDVLSDPDKKREYDELISPHTSTSYTPPDYDGYTYNPSSSYYKTRASKRNAQAQGSKYSYENYKKTYNSSGAYDYNKRYTDYHRSKTPNSNYAGNNPDSSSISKESIIQLSKSSKIFIIGIILILYVIFFISNIMELSNIMDSSKSSSKEETSTSSSQNKKNNKESSKENDDDKDKNNEDDSNYDFDFDIESYIYGTPSQTYEEYYNEKYNNTVEEEKSPAEEFDINTVFTDSELREVYDSYFQVIYPTFEEFKKAMGEYYYQTYYQDYY